MLVAQNLPKIQLIKPKSLHPERDLEFSYKPLETSDATTLFFALKRNKDHIATHFSWAEEIDNQGMYVGQRYVEMLLRETEKDHFLFFLGHNTFVGQGTLSPIGGVPEHRQIALWVDEKWINKGLGTRIAATLEHIAFEEHGYQVLFYTHDENNLASERIAFKQGFEPHCVFKSEDIARSDSGNWKCWAKDNPIFSS